MNHLERNGLTFGNPFFPFGEYVPALQEMHELYFKYNPPQKESIFLLKKKFDLIMGTVFIKIKTCKQIFIIFPFINIFIKIYKFI